MMLAVVPFFLVGIHAPVIKSSLDLSSLELGVAISCSSVAASIFAISIGRGVRAYGLAWCLKLSSLLAFFSLILIGKFVQKWWELAIALGLGGVANALAQTSMNFTSTHSSTSDQRASVFGLKQASIPTISLIIALLSPILLRYGSWRLGFLLAAVFSLIGIIMNPKLDLVVSSSGIGLKLKRHQKLIAFFIIAGGFFSGLISTGLSAFISIYVTSNGFTISKTGFLLALGSVLAVVARILGGLYIDKHLSNGIQEFIAISLVGCIGFLLLAISSDIEILIIFGSILAFGSAWGWPGFIHFAVISLFKTNSIRIGSFVLSAIYAGNTVGPSVMGILVEYFSFSIMWSFCAVAFFTAGLCFVIARILIGLLSDYET
jgi:MFS family permease